MRARVGWVGAKRKPTIYQLILKVRKTDECGGRKKRWVERNPPDNFT
jgi:hypothetical protein